MNTEEAKEFAKTMTYRDAIYNLKQARCIPYKKATFEVINRLLDELDKLDNVKCEDAISRQAVLNTLDDIDKALDVDRTVENYKALLKECFENLTAVQLKAKTGHWINAKVGKLFPSNDFKCSECGNILDFDGVNCGRGDANYCPNCGAKMESEVKA